MDDALLSEAAAVLVLATFWCLFYSSSRGRLLGLKWSVLRLKHPWRQRVMWAGFAGTTVLLVAIIAGDLLPTLAPVVAGCVWLAALTCFLTWAVLLDPTQRFASEVHRAREVLVEETEHGINMEDERYDR